MSESESKTLTSGWSPEPKPHDQHQSDLQAEICRQQELDLLTIRVHGRARPAPSKTTRPPRPPQPRGKQKTAETLEHEPIIRKLFHRAPRAKCKADIDYCLKMQAEGLKTKVDWWEDGCPREYPAAWNFPDPAKQREFRNKIRMELRNAL
jgi:hypothetical protein